MSTKVVIVEDERMIAYDMEMMLKKAGYLVCGIADSVLDALELIEHFKPDIVLIDIFLKSDEISVDLGKRLKNANIAFIYLSANYQNSIIERVKATQPYGFLIKPFRESELLAMMDIALYRHQNGLEAKIRHEQVLEESFKSIAAQEMDWKERLFSVVKSLQPYLPFDYLVISETTEGLRSDRIFLRRKNYDSYTISSYAEFLELSGLNHVEVDGSNDRDTFIKPGYFNEKDFQELCSHSAIKRSLAISFHLRSMLHLPVLSSAGKVINLSFFSSRADTYDVEHLRLLSRLNHSLTVAIEAVLPLQALNKTENEFPIDYLHGEKGKPAIFKKIIGDCNELLSVLDHVSIAAPIDTSILILGESGTGKEQIAKSIHELSPRRNNSLVIINCASLPTNLIESELFGHEKGSFTGAIEKRIGKFELADKGTVFLDEIGELPIELQGKLLRVLQEQEIERIGGSKTVRINVRVIAATNRNLETEIREGRFRLDLYYRLSVFPIRLPALRERKTDIPKLVLFFCKKFSRKFGKNVSGVSSQVMSSLQSYRWPGNIRELENFVERSVLLCKDNIITKFDHFSFEPDCPCNCKAEQMPPLTKMIDENVKEHILSVLKQCDGKISGAGGAAEHLGIPATTLHSKIKRLGLKKW